MNLFLVIIALLLIVCIDHEVRINRLENDNDIIEGSDGLLAGVILLSFPLAAVCWMVWRDVRHEGEAEPATEWTDSIR